MSSVIQSKAHRLHRTTLGRLKARLGHIPRPGIRAEAAAAAAPVPAAPPNPLKPIIPRMCTVRDDEVSLLESLVKESNGLPGPIIEIGTLLGVSTTNMALWKSPSKKIITVDLFAWNPWGLTSEQHRDVTTQMLHYLTRTNHVELVVSCKNAFYESYQGEPPSLVFLDAIHDYPETAKDIAWARSVGARIISGHDYSADFPGVIEAVDEVGGPKQLEGSVWRL